MDKDKLKEFIYIYGAVVGISILLLIFLIIAII